MGRCGRGDLKYTRQISRDAGLDPRPERRRETPRLSIRQTSTERSENARSYTSIIVKAITRFHSKRDKDAFNAITANSFVNAVGHRTSVMYRYTRSHTYRIAPLESNYLNRKSFFVSCYELRRREKMDNGYLKRETAPTTLRSTTQQAQIAFCGAAIFRHSRGNGPSRMAGTKLTLLRNGATRRA